MDGGMSRGWLPQQITAIPLPQLLALFGEHAPDAGEYMSADDQLAIINQERAKMGKPPVRKRPRTFAEAARCKREQERASG